MAIFERCLSATASKIYTLAEMLVQANVYPWANDPLVSIYQKLFITQAALCELYFRYEEKGGPHLVLNTVSVYLLPRNDDDSAEASRIATPSIMGDDMLYSPNVDFFSDAENFYKVSAEDVASLMAKFWRDYGRSEILSSGQQHEALSVLELPEDASWHKIQHRYRALASRMHPDRGGDKRDFIRVRSAYEQLKAYFRQ